MSREIVLRVRVDDSTSDLLDSIARYNDLPKAQVALHFLLAGLDDYAQVARQPGLRKQDALQRAA
jgi:hypothetical protein